MANDIIVPEIVDAIQVHEAKLNITHEGQQGDLPDPIPFDASDADIKGWAIEAVATGIPGIRPQRGVDFTDFVVDRFAATPGVPVNRVVLRPKTPFGG